MFKQIDESGFFFQIDLHKKDKVLLEQIKNYYGLGNLYIDNTKVRYLVTSIKDLQVIIEHFYKYPLYTKKCADFLLWKKAFDLVQNKEHLTMQGLQKIVAIKDSLNLGLSVELKSAFPTIVPVQRPVVDKITKFDPYWLAAFTSAEGCFLIRIYKSKTKLGMAVKLVFQLTQHNRDEQLMRSLIKYFDCGNIYKDREAFKYQVEKFSDIYNKIIPFFYKYRIQGVKSLDYLDWCKVAELIKIKAHLTEEGLDQIREIKAGINKGRQV